MVGRMANNRILAIDDTPMAAVISRLIYIIMKVSLNSEGTRWEETKRN